MLDLLILWSLKRGFHKDETQTSEEEALAVGAGLSEGIDRSWFREGRVFCQVDTVTATRSDYYPRGQVLLGKCWQEQKSTWSLHEADEKEQVPSPSSCLAASLQHSLLADPDTEPPATRQWGCQSLSSSIPRPNVEEWGWDCEITNSIVNGTTDVHFLHVYL